MNRLSWLALFITAATFCWDSDIAFAQVAGPLSGNRLQGTLDVQNARIGEQRVQRQTEIMRLEGIIRTLESRVTRLERQLLATARLPAITMAEAEADLRFAEAQLQESEQLHEKSEVADVRVASDRLAVARARGQLDAAKAAHGERLITLELDVLYAEQLLAQQTREKSQLERLVAKGYTSTDALRSRLLEIGVAEKQVQLARLRLEAERKSSGEKDLPAMTE